MRVEDKKVMNRMYELLMEITEMEASFYSVQRTEIVERTLKSNYQISDSVLLEDFLNDVEQGVKNIKAFYRKKR